MKFLRKILTISILICATVSMPAKSTDEIYNAYIEKYAPMAVEQQTKFGIPASVTIAQGILESAAGRSRLAREGNNHFGIKCHTEWTGDTMLRSDDAPNECFRVYTDALQSFEDHSRFLTRRRYASLFELEPDDYAGWCRGLGKCGYATDPNYAPRLISIIDRYALYRFDVGGGSRHEAETADFIITQLQQRHPVRKSRGLHYVIANPGDTYKTLATELKMDGEKLALLNDADDLDCEIRPWEEVYLQPKHDTAPDDVRRVTIGEGESLHSVAQRFGMSVKSIRNLNPTSTFAEGSVIRLR